MRIYRFSLFYRTVNWLVPIEQLAGLYSDLPVTRSSTELSVVFDFWLSATGPYGGHTSIREGKSDHLTGTGGGKNLGGERKK